VATTSGLPVVPHERIGGKPDLAHRGNDSPAPVAETVTIGSDRDRWIGNEVIGDGDVGDTHGMDVQRQNIIGIGWGQSNTNS
jgi:hypothetical protein